MSFNVLCLGLSPEWLSAAEARGLKTGMEDVSAKVEASIQKFQEGTKQYHDTHFELFGIEPDNQTNWDEFVTLLKGRKWVAVSVGGGVRTIHSLGDLFTKVIHETIRQQPQTKLIFPLVPDQILTELEKYVPEAN